jgi:16S rRNA (cytidine1402-2'-O)-methyltransferase
MATPETGPAVGTLWIVATPIGSLGDLSPRAIEVLADVPLILAEDTRRTRALLAHAGVSAGRRLLSLRRENEAKRVPQLLEVLRSGASVALVSDAGTPVLSDPGFVLVREALGDGLRVASVPGPSAFTAALAASGQPPLPATLVGFLPPRSGSRRERVARLATVSWTLVVLLSPHRLAAELGDLAAGLGADRPATLLVELSKLHERSLTGSLGGLASCDEVRNPRGEYVVVIGPKVEAPPDRVGPAAIREAYERLVSGGHERREALRETARRLGLNRRDVYRALLETE